MFIYSVYVSKYPVIGVKKEFPEDQLLHAIQPMASILHFCHTYFGLLPTAAELKHLSYQKQR